MTDSTIYFIPKAKFRRRPQNAWDYNSVLSGQIELILSQDPGHQDLGELR